MGPGSEEPRLLYLEGQNSAGLGLASWSEQVAAMASTGILVAVHGAGEANAIYLPSGAAVIELFPWKFHKSTYRGLATSMGHWYRDVLAVDPPDPNDVSNNRHASDLAYSRVFYDRCIATNLSSAEFHYEAICNMGVRECHFFTHTHTHNTHSNSHPT